MDRRIGRGRAFTLIEILVVVVILGIAGAIIVPQISSRDDLRASAAARVIMSDLIYAQNLSITKQQNHYVVFSTSGQTYRLVTGASMTVINHPITKNPYQVRFGASGTAGMENVQIVSASFVGTGAGGSTSATIGFDELGTPLVYVSGATQPMTSGAIVVRSGEQSLRIDIEPYTGQLRATPQ